MAAERRVSGVDAVDGAADAVGHGRAGAIGTGTRGAGLAAQAQRRGEVIDERVELGAERSARPMSW